MERDGFLDKLRTAHVAEVVFVIDDNNKFIAYLYEGIDELTLVSRGTIIWHSLGQRPVELVTDSPGSLFDAFRVLYLRLQKLLRGKLEYPFATPEKDLGYLLNLRYADDPRAKHEDENRILSYEIWGYYLSPNVWLYAQEEKIFLEITPFYAWTVETIAAEEDDTLEAFRERMAAYKPLAKFVMRKEMAQQWYEQSKGLVTIIYKNFERAGGFPVDIETELEASEE